MDYKWEQFGDEIKQSVQDAVERGDFSRLNQTVNDSVSRAADAISRGMKMGAGIVIQKPIAAGIRIPEWQAAGTGQMPHGTEADSRMSDHSIRHKVRCVI